MSSKTRIIKSVSFTNREYDVLEFAESKGKFSDYIKSLIRREMNCSTVLTPELKVEIRKYIDENFKMTLSKEDDVQHEYSQVENSIDEILNM
jgi:hypothetical protein